MRVGIAMLCICLGSATPASAGRSLAITVSGECPTRDAVIAAIESGLPDVTVTDEPGPNPRVLVTDDGASYRIEADGATRTLDDSSADCEERARTVAVVAALAVEPPRIDAGTPREIRPALWVPKPPAITPAIEREHEPATATAVQIEAGGVFENALGSDGDLRTTGVDLRLAVARAGNAIVVGGVVGTPISVDVMEGRARVHRVPLDMALRSRLGKGGLTAAAIEVGPRFTIQHSERADAMQRESATRLEMSARLAARFEVWPSWSRAGAYVLLQGEYVPRPSRFTLPGRGVIGEMPLLWIGASLGLAVPLL